MMAACCMLAFLPVKRRNNCPKRKFCRKELLQDEPLLRVKSKKVDSSASSSVVLGSLLEISSAESKPKDSPPPKGNYSEEFFKTLAIFL
ncbi:hypothetical protein ElyMa_004042900 [Elysia marginata]|uniref:Uncharacterized protein n=1 Tax=Elysia marginata TaxID=1093978 RepID=A0AAV4G567_9GAST|nr:hypothetical protein ElyMa_004042900 [Elysia marginata]